MGLDRMVTSSVKVWENNVVELHPGGHYNLNEDNCVETAVVKLHLLEHFCQLAAESWSHNGENNIVLGTEIEALADLLYSKYEKFIANGVNVFELNEYYMQRELDKYTARPICNGQLNATAEETEDGLPPGWWYDWPGCASKTFEEGRIAIDCDEHVRVGFYKPFDTSHEACIEMIEIDGADAITKIYAKCSTQTANEIMQAIAYVKEQYQI